MIQMDPVLVQVVERSNVVILSNDSDGSNSGTSSRKVKLRRPKDEFVKVSPVFATMLDEQGREKYQRSTKEVPKKVPKKYRIEDFKKELVHIMPSLRNDTSVVIGT